MNTRENYNYHDNFNFYAQMLTRNRIIQLIKETKPPQVYSSYINTLITNITQC